MDVDGVIDGRTLGVAVFDSPKSFRHPTYWHARGYGLLAANPFGLSFFFNDPHQDGSYTIPAGKSIQFRYRVFIHDGNYKQAHVAEKYSEYAATVMAMKYSAVSRNGGEAEMDESRREFLKTGAKVVAVVTAAERLRTWSTPRNVLGANDRVRVAIVGLRGRGENHIQAYGALPNVEIAALCDVDDNVMRERLAQVQKLGFQPKTYTDIRKILDDKSIDAVSIATPHHWHALMAIWACQAGKDVYVEKPCSHNLWEGRQLVRAAAKYNRIVQHGTQTRSDPEVMQAVQKMQEGLLGDVYLSRGLCFKWRDTIGHTPVSPVPQELITTCGPDPRPCSPLRKIISTTTGIGSGTMATAIWAIRASISWMSRDGDWAWVSPTKSPRSAATSCSTMTSKRPTL